MNTLRARLACGTFCGKTIPDALEKSQFSPPLAGGDEGEGKITYMESTAYHPYPHPNPPPSRGREFRTFYELVILCLLVLLPAALLALGGCAGLPPLKPLDPSLAPSATEACKRPFLTQKYRLVHEMKAILPGGMEGTGIGVLVADPRTGRFESVLMTIEGPVLFDIESGDTLTVHRAVPPFNTPAFAQRMAEDIRLAFFPPGKKPSACGQDKEGAVVCRFEAADGESVDVVTGKDGAMEIRLYGAGQELRKKVSIPRLERPGLADDLEIRSIGWPSYSLHLRLIEAEAVESD